MSEISKLQLAQFSNYASNPETWIFSAKRHLAVADILFKHLVNLRLMQGRPIEEYSGCHSAYYLHGGIATENAVKAVLIARDSKIVLPNGTLDASKLGTRGGHGLHELVVNVLHNITKEEKLLLLKLEEFVVWAGRYTVPMKAKVLYSDDVMGNLREAPANENEMLNSLVNRLLELALGHSL